MKLVPARRLILAINALNLQHIEFFHTDHFENNYHRVPPPSGLAHLIDFFWETKFDGLWKDYPHGFSDVQFPNIGYTNIINLGSPFVMQVDDKKFNMKTDGFLPRYHAIECFHKPGNHLFGIKFRISPVLFEKKINFSEYRGFIFPLSYLLEETLIGRIKKAAGFEERIADLSNHFLSVLAKQDGSLHQIHIVSHLLDKCYQGNHFSLSLEDVAQEHHISVRTLQRYFENCVGISTKKAIQVMRIRKAVAQIVHAPESFQFADYGYYDRSHFYKHLRCFLQKTTLKNVNTCLPLLSSLRK